MEGSSEVRGKQASRAVWSAFGETSTHLAFAWYLFQVTYM